MQIWKFEIWKNGVYSLKKFLNEIKIFRYAEEVYYMRDPFEPPDIHKKTKDYITDDFLMIGSNCYICNQQICIDEVY